MNDMYTYVKRTSVRSFNVNWCNRCSFASYLVNGRFGQSYYSDNREGGKRQKGSTTRFGVSFCEFSLFNSTERIQMPVVSLVSKRLRKIAKGESFAYGLVKHRLSTSYFCNPAYSNSLDVSRYNIKRCRNRNLSHISIKFPYRESNPSLLGESQVS